MQLQPSSIATRNGVIAGVVLGILSLTGITMTAVGVGGRALQALYLLVALIVFAVVGFSASRYSGLLRSGVWAGFLAGLITAFIAVCLGVVILTLLASNASLAAPVARRGGHGAAAHLALAARLAFVRISAGGLILLAGGFVAGLIGGSLGRIGRRRGAREQGAPYVASADDAQTRAYMTPPPPPAQAYAGGYTPAPQSASSATPPPYYPTATAYDDSTPTTVRDSQD
jgi:hypothetical protein